MDYLNALPVEIWREIFLRAAPFSTLPIDMSKSRNFTESSISQYEALQEAQSTRLRLLTICKSFLPLIEQLLYTEITLHGQKRIERFVTTTTTTTTRKQSNDSNRLNWTKSASLFDCCEGIDSEDGAPNLEMEVAWDMTRDTNLYTIAGAQPASLSTPPHCPSLFSICPALVYLFLDERGESWFPNTLKMTGIQLQNLKILAVISLGQHVQILRALADFAPNLEHLNLHSRYNDFEEVEGVISIPSVRSVRIHRPEVVNKISNLRFPSLRQLTFMIYSMGGVSEFLRHHASMLRELELITYVEAWQYHLDIPDDLFTICRQLRKLTFDATNISTPKMAMVTPHHNLQVLVLSMETPTAKSDIENKAQYFSRDGFPNLCSVTCHFRAVCDIMDIADFRRRASPVFPVELKLAFEDKILELI